MHPMFDISTLKQLEKAFNHYLAHMSKEHHLNLKKETKAREKFAKFLGFDNYSQALGVIRKKEELQKPCEPSPNELCREMNEATLMMSMVDPKGSFYKENTVSFYSKRSDKVYTVEATMYTDDGFHKVDFDASPVFFDLLENSEESVLAMVKELYEDDFGSGYGTDKVAEYFADYKGKEFQYLKVKEAFEHIRNLPEDVEERGFSVVIDEKSLLLWLKGYCSLELMEKYKKYFE